MTGRDTKVALHRVWWNGHVLWGIWARAIRPIAATVRPVHAFQPANDAVLAHPTCGYCRQSQRNLLIFPNLLELHTRSGILLGRSPTWRGR
jgi:hypothetical protein